MRRVHKCILWCSLRSSALPQWTAQVWRNNSDRLWNNEIIKFKQSKANYVYNKLIISQPAIIARHKSDIKCNKVRMCKLRVKINIAYLIMKLFGQGWIIHSIWLFIIWINIFLSLLSKYKFLFWESLDTLFDTCASRVVNTLNNAR